MKFEFLLKKHKICDPSAIIGIYISKFTYEDPTDFSSKVHLIEQIYQPFSIKQIRNLTYKLNNTEYFDPSIVPTFDAELLNEHDPETVKKKEEWNVLHHVYQSQAKFSEDLRKNDFESKMFADFQTYVEESKKQRFHTERLILPDLWQTTFKKEQIEEIGELDIKLANLEITIFEWNTAVEKIMKENENQKKLEDSYKNDGLFASKKLNTYAKNFDSNPESMKNTQASNSQHHLGFTNQDTFGASLRYVDELLTSRYGYASRFAPSHGPHLINKFAMQELQQIFPDEYFKTSSHKFRQKDDMQMAFAYYYFILKNL